MRNSAPGLCRGGFWFAPVHQCCPTTRHRLQAPRTTMLVSNLAACCSSSRRRRAQEKIRWHRVVPPCGVLGQPGLLTGTASASASDVGDDRYLVLGPVLSWARFSRERIRIKRGTPFYSWGVSMGGICESAID